LNSLHPSNAVVVVVVVVVKVVSGDHVKKEEEDLYFEQKEVKKKRRIHLVVCYNTYCLIRMLLYQLATTTSQS